MKLAQIANKSWWVPERNRTKLAVEINNPDQYLGAVEEKLLALVEAEGMPKALQTAQWLMEPDGVVLQETDDPEQLVGQLLATAAFRGGLSTLSTLAVDTVSLWRAGRHTAAVLNLTVTAAAGVLG